MRRLTTPHHDNALVAGDDPVKGCCVHLSCVQNASAKHFGARQLRRVWYIAQGSINDHVERALLHRGQLTAHPYAVHLEHGCARFRIVVQCAHFAFELHMRPQPTCVGKPAYIVLDLVCARLAIHLGRIRREIESVEARGPHRTVRLQAMVGLGRVPSAADVVTRLEYCCMLNAKLLEPVEAAKTAPTTADNGDAQIAWIAPQPMRREEDVPGAHEEGEYGNKRQEHACKGDIGREHEHGGRQAQPPRARRLGRRPKTRRQSRRDLGARPIRHALGGRATDHSSQVERASSGGGSADLARRVRT
mmetsp:Transcript_17065/g.43722  ORF Transcript_17065/g.43722 Transcript_17065/m.43722 type:complete len:304 (-) Transcript_17065:20-931(-)